MKTLIVLAAAVATLGISAANAATDIFDCSAKIVDLKTNDVAESTGSAAGYRMVTPIDNSTGQPYPPGMEVSSAKAKTSLSLKGKQNSYKVEFKLHYGFAKRTVGNTTEARQYVCNEVSLSGCQDNQCLGAGTACAVISDPFHPKYGWDETSISKNVPVFNERLLRPLDTVIPISSDDPDGAHVRVSCKFNGTYL